MQGWREGRVNFLCKGGWRVNILCKSGGVGGGVGGGEGGWRRGWVERRMGGGLVVA